MLQFEKKKNATARTVMQMDKNESDARRKVENKHPKMPLLGEYHEMIDDKAITCARSSAITY